MHSSKPLCILAWTSWKPFLLPHPSNLSPYSCLTFPLFYVFPLYVLDPYLTVFLCVFKSRPVWTCQGCQEETTSGEIDSNHSSLCTWTTTESIRASFHVSQILMRKLIDKKPWRNRISDKILVGVTATVSIASQNTVCLIQKMTPNSQLSTFEEIDHKPWDIYIHTLQAGVF